MSSQQYSCIPTWFQVSEKQEFAVFWIAANSVSSSSCHVLLPGSFSAPKWGLLPLRAGAVSFLRIPSFLGERASKLRTDEGNADLRALREGAGAGLQVLPWRQRGACSCFTEGHGCQQEEQERGVTPGFPGQPRPRGYLR